MPNSELLGGHNKRRHGDCSFGNGFIPAIQTLKCYFSRSQGMPRIITTQHGFTFD
ncbi:hypothetical protein LguiB_016479 [Lonicera macranthoides]